MTSISIEALKGKTIKEIRELIRQAERLPENQSPTEPGIVNGIAKGCGKKVPCRYNPWNHKCGDLCGYYADRGVVLCQECSKTQTAQELLEEIENES